MDGFFTFMLALIMVFILTLFSLRREGRLLNILNILVLVGLIATNTNEFIALYDIPTILITVLLISINFLRLLT